MTVAYETFVRARLDDLSPQSVPACARIAAGALEEWLGLNGFTLVGVDVAEPEAPGVVNGAGLSDEAVVEITRGGVDDGRRDP